MTTTSRFRLETKATRIALMALPLVMSTILVFWNLQGLGLSHWDEFNYIVTAQWFLRRPGGTFTIYEPPGFPFLVAVFFKIFGESDYVAIAVSGIFAVATVGLVTYLGLRLFGLEVSLTAPIMLVLSPLFLTYSRMALTDMTFTFFFSLALVAMYFATKSLDSWWTALAAFAFAACTMVKYNGFMSLATFACYLLILLGGLRGSARLKVALRWLRKLVMICIPSLILNFSFVLMLGISTLLPARQVFSLHALRSVELNLLYVLAKGFAKFNTAAMRPHAGQLSFLPLTAAPFYIQVLAVFVPGPVLLLAIIGLLRKNFKDTPALFVSVWLLASFFLISSVPSHYSRAILPVLPPLALCAGLGLSRVGPFLHSAGFARWPTLKPKFAWVIPAVLILVIALSVPGALQAVSMEHQAYRQAGELLASFPGRSPVLEQAQLVMGFYYPASFGKINATSLAKNRFIVIDFIGAENGYLPAIQQFTEQGRIKLVGTIPNDLPPEVYLDSMSFQELSRWNYTYIQIYEVVNGTATQ